MGFSNKMFVHLLIINISLFSLSTKSTAELGFNCSQRPTCNSLIGYRTPNSTTLSHLQSVFGVNNLNSLLAANNLHLSTSPNYTVQESQEIKIPIPCKCSNGRGVSDKVPVYIVQKEDGLYHIAKEVFMALVTFPQIQEFNEIQDPNRIDVGQELRIPLPCSCDDVEGERVVHYAYVAKEGDSMEKIAEEFGSTSEVLVKRNGIDNSQLKAEETVIDIPLKACNSSVTSSSRDYPLLVPNGTYAYTANSCVRCKCDSANNWILQCEPSGLTPSSNSSWTTCPSMSCNGGDNLMLGSTTTVGCNATTCAYSGYSQNISTILASVSTCPTSSPGSDNYASRISWSWSFFVVSFQLIMLCVHLLQ